MKKLFSLLLALVMIACMSVTLFADNSTTVLTVEVPAATPSYILHVPASVTLEYGNTEKQTIGGYYVTDVSNIECLWCAPVYTDLINTEDTTDTISLKLYLLAAGKVKEIDKNGFDIVFNQEPMLYWKGHVSTDSSFDNGYLKNNQGLSAQVSDWSDATPGATYQATITYIVSVS